LYTGRWWGKKWTSNTRRESRIISFFYK